MPPLPQRGPIVGVLVKMSCMPQRHGGPHQTQAYQRHELLAALSEPSPITLTAFRCRAQAQSVKINPDQAKQVAPDLTSPPGTDDKTADDKKVDAETVSEPVLKPELKSASKPKTKGADGRREAAEARRLALLKVHIP